MEPVGEFPSARSRAGSPRRDAELRLARYARTRDPADRDALVREFLPLARSAALRYRHTRESFDDLVQVAALGLLKAIERFDPDRGYAFSSFAVPTMLGELRRHLRDHSRIVRLPRGLQELSQRVPRATDELTAELGRAPTIGELARRLEVSEEAVLDARHAMATQSPASLDAPMGDGEDAASLGELLGGEDAAFTDAEDAVVLGSYLAQLSPIEREVLRLRFQEDLSQHEIGARVGVSQMQVSRLIRRSLERLRAAQTP